MTSNLIALSASEEAALMRFEDAWEAGKEPTLTDYASPDSRVAFLRELVMIDLERRFQYGQVPTVESYLQSFPALAADEQAVRDLTDTQAELRRRYGPPAELGGYRVLEKLGQGGMGVVYRAEDPDLGRHLALKVIHPELLVAADARLYVARFLEEARTLAAIGDSNVVSIYKAKQNGGRPFLAMEYCPGGTLADRLERVGRLPPGEAAAVVRKVSRGVAAAHKEGIFHRDLKPGNVLFDAAGQPKVADFGLAKRGAGPGLTRSNAIMGSPAYMAPEQVEGRGKFADARTDVWALGVILYECLTHQRPFDADDPPAVLRQVIERDPDPPGRHVPDLPRSLAWITLKCLEKDPARRYATAGDLADDLDRFLKGEPVVARPASLWVKYRLWCYRNPIAAGLAAIAIMFLFGGLTATTILWQRADRQRAAADEQRVAADHSRAEAELARQDARDALAFQQDLFQASDPFGFTRPVFLTTPGGPRDATARDLLHRGRAVIDQRPLSPLSRAAILHSMGHAYRGLGETATAEPLLLEALAIRRERLGERHEDYIETLLAVGLLRHVQLQTDEAVRVFRQALALSREVYPEIDPRVGDAAFYLAYALLLQFDLRNPDRGEGGALLNEAERIYRAAGNRKRELSRVQSAQLCLKLFREGPRLDPLTVAAEIRAQVDGPEKDLVRDTFLKHQFAQWARQRRDLPKAEALYKELLETIARHVEPSHILYVAALADYGTLLRDMGRKDEAYGILSGIYELVRRHPLRHHPKLTEPLTYYGMFLIELKKWAEAEPVFRDALQCARENGQQAESRSLAARLAGILRELGREAEAQEVERGLPEPTRR